jgi:hypothetical protein
MTRRFHAEFLDAAGRVEHNMTGTLEDIAAAAHGRAFVITGEAA